MNLPVSFQLKLKLIYIPYLLIGVSFLLSYSLFNWLFNIRFEVLALNDELANYWLPFILTWIPILLFLRPRVKIIVNKKSKGDLTAAYCFIAAFSIFISTFIAQNYLTTATGKLTVLQSIDEITNQPLTKYYKIKNHRIDKRNPGVYRRSETSGKNNERLTFYVDVVCPITSFKDYSKAWLGTEYSKTISNNLSDAEKENEYKSFNKETYYGFRNQNLDKFTYLVKASISSKRKGFVRAIQSIQGNTTTPVFEAKTEPFENRNGNKLLWIFGSFAIGSFILLIVTLIPSINQSELTKFYARDSKQSLKTIRLIFGVFTLKNQAFVTTLIISLNLLVFIIMIMAGLGFISFNVQDLLVWGADFRQYVIEGQWWRLFTCIFLHGGLMHLLMNMYGLFFVGIFLEPLLGKAKFAITYFVCGLFASIVSIWWHPETISIGASGAIFGMYGIFIALLLTKRANLSISKGLLVNCLVFVVLNLLVGILGNIDNAAHIGGLLSGLVIGYILHFNIEQYKPQRKYVRKKKMAVGTIQTGGENE